jgi:hypothetical protein
MPQVRELLDSTLYEKLDYRQPPEFACTPPRDHQEGGQPRRYDNRERHAEQQGDEGEGEGKGGERAPGTPWS